MTLIGNAYFITKFLQVAPQPNSLVFYRLYPLMNISKVYLKRHILNASLLTQFLVQKDLNAYP